ncbi:hypothetical protein EG329_002799 [Mollisiaceae sp. DMI_Dod_QoI]|nr:hypothetical protein EG329_002799 [Helotiales sp. DMI_Dod_QoI]
MHTSIPLTDEDRSGWLQTLAATCIDALATNSLVIVSCSALKCVYRQVFRTAVENNNIANHLVTVIAKVDDIKLRFLFLSMSQDKAAHLVKIRAENTGHFMPATLVSSQYEILEIPGEKETDCHVLDSNFGVEEVKAGALKILDSLIAEE